jgi:hypothetical protein
MTTLVELLRREPIEMQAVCDHLDGLTHDARVEQVRAVGGGLQSGLYAACEGFKAVDATTFVPDDVPDRTWVRHYGKNSLPVFTKFEKRFVRPVAGSEELWGYNHGPTMRFAGPGYYVVRGAADAAEMDIDYYKLPTETIPGGPKVKPNTTVPANLIYGYMVDVMRGVSEHVTIGRAIKKGKKTGNYFMLVREA